VQQASSGDYGLDRHRAYRYCLFRALMRDQSWDCKDLRHMLDAMIGRAYGEDPVSALERIRSERKHIADFVDSYLHFDRNDVVMDLGSGTGFVARYVAPKVKHIHCMDISKDFAAFCAKELQAFDNVSVHLMNYADFSMLSEQPNKIYSHGVFIHFNFYDLTTYLRKIYDLLPAGGMLMFDFADAELVAVDQNENFKSHIDLYKAERTGILGLMNWNGRHAVRSVVKQVGFELLREDNSYDANTAVLLRK
jgi:protein-L-isoaspartate O-methyltransferase